MSDTVNVVQVPARAEEGVKTGVSVEAGEVFTVTRNSSCPGRRSAS